jgi:hypothetical protein
MKYLPLKYLPLTVAFLLVACRLARKLAQYRMHAAHNRSRLLARDLACYCRPFDLVNISAGKDSVNA